MIMENKKQIFLLGGHDLEMLEIRNILERKNLKNEVDFYDRNLTWGAKLSSYKDCFDDDKTFVGIELIIDIDPPKKYIEIDHHNENSIKASSLEQTAEFIGAKLSRKQNLIAANDRGYIPEMIKLGANVKEIQKIRKSDRKEQGATRLDEKLAEKSIRENMQVENGITVVRSLTSFFSTITDRLFPFQKLLIYNETNYCYYGEGTDKLALHFHELVNAKNAWYGGGEDGFFGIRAEYTNANEIIEIIK